LESSYYPVGFTEVPGGSRYADRSALSFHYYAPYPDTLNRTIHFTSRTEDMKRLRTGGMLTEFNIAAADANVPPTPNQITNTTEMMKTVETCDDYLLSWIGWEYKPFWPITGASYSVFHLDGTSNLEVIGTLVRPYAQAVAGRTAATSFNNSTKLYTLEFDTTDVTAE
jgi:endoglycosylceramidase